MRLRALRLHSLGLKGIKNVFTCLHICTDTRTKFINYVKTFWLIRLMLEKVFDCRNFMYFIKLLLFFFHLRSKRSYLRHKEATYQKEATYAISPLFLLQVANFLIGNERQLFSVHLTYKNKQKQHL